MKFLKEDGTIEDGIALKDEDAAMMVELERYLHICVCKNAYHGHFDKQSCRAAASFITQRVSQDGTGLSADIVKAEADSLLPRPRVPAVVPSPAPADWETSSKPEISDDDIPL